MFPEDYDGTNFVLPVMVLTVIGPARGWGRLMLFIAGMSLHYGQTGWVTTRLGVYKTRSPSSIFLLLPLVHMEVKTSIEHACIY